MCLFLAAVQKASQSGNLLNLGDNIKIDIKHFSSKNVQMGNVGKIVRLPIANALYCVQRRWIAYIQNADDFCILRAIVLGIAKHNANVTKKITDEKKFDLLWHHSDACSTQTK